MRHKYWAWVTSATRLTVDEWKHRFAIMREAGIDAVLLQVYQSEHAYYSSNHLPVREAWLETILPIAKAAGLESHAWLWVMPCNIPEINIKHPEWFMVNALGESVVEKPAYVSYYKFMCPSRPEVHEYVCNNMTELAQYSDIDGIHLDYIRYPDVILAEALQSKYNIKQDREYPEYDYCYCTACQNDFETQTGVNPLILADPGANDAWRQFRYDRITNLVNNTLVPIARKYDKTISAAVFPNWKNVRQQWAAWHLDAILPMLYHGFYNSDVNWIKQQTENGVKALPETIPLYSGLFAGHLLPKELPKAIEASLAGGAKGVSIFRAATMTNQHWASFCKAVN